MSDYDTKSATFVYRKNYETIYFLFHFKITQYIKNHCVATTIVHVFRLTYEAIVLMQLEECPSNCPQSPAKYPILFYFAYGATISRHLPILTRREVLPRQPTVLIQSSSTCRAVLCSNRRSLNSVQCQASFDSGSE